jgi:DNA-binding transcriptional ArsR family regulator
MRRKRHRAAQAVEAAPLFAALGDPIRLGIVRRLCDDGPLSTIQLKAGTHVSRQAITKHLQVLEGAGLVGSDRVGRDRHWRLQAQKLAALRGYLDQISAQWDTRLERLRALVEEDGS